MNLLHTDNIYLPKVAVIDRVMDEIAEVKTFYWHFDDPEEQGAFSRFRPGQFAQVSLFGVGEFPASLPPSPTEKETFFTIRQVGSCTAALHKLTAGDKFAVRGPYGNGFPMEDYYGKNLVFVAGGIGLIPLRSCIVYALKHRDKYERIQIYYGSKTPKELMYVADLREWEQVCRCRVLPYRGPRCRRLDRQRGRSGQPVQENPAYRCQWITLSLLSAARRSCSASSSRTCSRWGSRTRTSYRPSSAT